MIGFLCYSSADKRSYTRITYDRLCRGEIDPGSNEFWNREVYKKLHGKESMPEAVALEIEDERVIYTKEQANAILERLYKAGKIPPEEMYVNPDHETPGKPYPNNIHLSINARLSQHYHQSPLFLLYHHCSIVVSTSACFGTSG